MVDLEDKEITEEEPEFDLTHTVSDDDDVDGEVDPIAVVDPLALPLDAEIAEEEEEEDLLPDMIQEGEEPEAL